MGADLRDFDILPIALEPGVEPPSDNTNQATVHYVASQGIRFFDGKSRKRGGWVSYDFDDNNDIVGVARTLYSQRIATFPWLLIGTNLRLYAVLGTELTNITPLDTTPVAIANSLDTNYGLLANNPITTVNGSTTVTFAYANTNNKLRAGDTVTVSGVPGDVNGIPVAQLNANLFVRTAGLTSFTVTVATAATSSGSGGGAAVNLATAIITVNDVAHGQSDGNRVLISGATATGGIPNGEINIEHIIRAGTADLFYISCVTRATSAVTGGGGAATEIQYQIPAGNADASSGMGYGMGQYGVGEYGVSKTSADGLILPRIWSFDAYGDLVVMTPGQQTGVYNWDGDTDEAPTLLSGAPSAVNYVFQSQNIIVTLGSGNVGNRVKWSDQGNATTWTATAQNQAGEIDIQGVGVFIGHSRVSDTVNLLFTNNEVVRMTYIGLPLVWKFEIIEQRIGMIAQNAHAALGSLVFWMGNTDLYMYDGAQVMPMPKNTLRQYIFNNINTVQQSKCWMGYLPGFRELWLGFPTEASNEIDTTVCITLPDYTYTPDANLARTAFESPRIIDVLPRMIYDTTLYKHEVGYNNDGASMPISLSSKYFRGDLKNLVELWGMLPDSIQTGDIELTINVKDYPQSTAVTSYGPYTISSTTDILNYPGMFTGRYWQYVITQDVLDGNWQAGEWLQLLKLGTEQL
jgi:hypothetical protein